MGSLHDLRRGSLATVVLVFAVLSAFLFLIVVTVDYFLLSQGVAWSILVVIPLAILFLALQWALAPAVVRWAARGLQPVTPQSNPWLFAAVRSLAQQAGVPPPRVWASPDPSPNAFVFGRTAASSDLVVTRGLLERLNQDEIGAVLAHEIGHLRHRDVVIMTWVSAVPLLAYVLARLGFEALRHGRGGGKKGGEALVAVLFVAAVSYLVYLVTQLLVLHLSRTREYYADSYSAAATRDPHRLASALTRISYGLSLARKDADPSGLRAFLVGDPVKAHQDYGELRDRMARYDLDRDGQIDGYELQRALEEERRNPWRRANALFSTHPPTYQRILALEAFEEEMKRSGLPANIYAFV